MSARSTFSGPIDVARAALAPHVTSSDWLAQPGKVESRARKQHRLQKLGPVIASLAPIQANLSFTPRLLKNTFFAIAADAPWFGSLENATKWAENNQKLLSSNLRAIHAAMKKKPRPTWITPITKVETTLHPYEVKGPAADTEEDDEGEDEEEEVEVEQELPDVWLEENLPSSPKLEDEGKTAGAEVFDKSSAEVQTAGSRDEYLFGWEGDAGSGCAWRAKLVKGRPQKKEFTRNIQADAKKDPRSGIIAIFDDDMTSEILDMPIEVHAAAAATKGAKAKKMRTEPAPVSKPALKPMALCDMATLPDGSRASISKVKDHQWLWRLAVAGKTLLRYTISKPRSLEIMKAILKKIADGTVKAEKSAVRELRDKIEKEGFDDADASRKRAADEEKREAKKTKVVETGKSKAKAKASTSAPTSSTGKSKAKAKATTSAPTSSTSKPEEGGFAEFDSFMGMGSPLPEFTMMR